MLVIISVIGGLSLRVEEFSYPFAIPLCHTQPNLKHANKAHVNGFFMRIQIDIAEMYPMRYGLLLKK